MHSSYDRVIPRGSMYNLTDRFSLVKLKMTANRKTARCFTWILLHVVYIEKCHYIIIMKKRYYIHANGDPEQITSTYLMTQKLHGTPSYISSLTNGESDWMIMLR